MTYVSPEWCTRWATRPTEYRDVADEFQLVHPDDRADAIREWALVVDHPGARGRHELRIRHGDGGYRWMEGIAVNKVDDPAVRGIVVRYRDITDRKLLEDRFGPASSASTRSSSTAPTGSWCSMATPSSPLPATR